MSEEAQEAVHTSEARARAIAQEVAGAVAAGISTQITGIANEKVDKETGKGLSTNDYTNEDKAQLQAAAEGVATLGNTKADKTNTYTKTQVDEKLSALMAGEEFDFSDWTNGALASAIKKIFAKLGGTVVEG